MKPHSNESEREPSIPAVEPSDQPLKADVRPGKKRHVLNLSLAGLPELEFFESEEKRETALAEIAKEAGRPTTWGYWTAMILLAFAAIATRQLIKWLFRYVNWPGELEDILSIVVIMAVAVVLIRKFHRQGFPAMLRRKLIEQGVPMCLKCGYNLRGQAADSTRCPECGTAINNESKTILAGREGN